MVVMEDASGQPMSLGSGFFIADEVVASNFHVVEGAARGYVKKVDEQKKFEITGFVGRDEVRDLVLIEVKGASAPALKIGDSKKLEIGEEIYAVGNPRGLEGTFSHGIISSIRQMGGGSLLQVTAPISPGSSGGPILNKNAEVIGVAAATFNGGQNLNFAIPSELLRALLKERRAVTPVDGSSKRNSKDSIFGALGSKITEGITAGRIRWVGISSFKFSVANQLRQPIKNAAFIVIFYEDENQPIDFKMVTLAKEIPAGLASWTKETDVDLETAKICNPEWPGTKRTGANPKVEFRVLDFEVVE